MSLRSRLAVAFAAIAVVVAGLMGILGYSATANQLENAADQSLLGRGGPPPGDIPGHRDGPRDDEIQQFITPSGDITRPSGTVQLPVTAADKAIAASSGPVVLARTEVIDGTPYRVVTATPGGGRGAMMSARDWSESAAVLRRLSVALALSALILAVIAAVIGWWLAGRITRRLVHLTGAAEEVSETGRLDVAVPAEGTDEVGRLATSFNTMLGRLAQSQADQQRLVQDAGHELRTPLTSLRTNISLLERFDELSPEVRQRVLEDLRGESQELTSLVNEVVGLAAGEGGGGERNEVVLAQIVEAVAERARRRSAREVLVTADDSVVMGSSAALERAIWNLVDNAAKFDDSGAPIEIRVTDGTVEVLDRGPGVAAQDIPHVFDRFYRPVSSRSLPGSGLGLAIVKDVAQAGGGEVYVHPRDGGGSAFGISLPVVGA